MFKSFCVIVPQLCLEWENTCIWIENDNADKIYVGIYIHVKISKASTTKYASMKNGMCWMEHATVWNGKKLALLSDEANGFKINIFGPLLSFLRKKASIWFHIFHEKSRVLISFSLDSIFSLVLVDENTSQGRIFQTSYVSLGILC